MSQPTPICTVCKLAMRCVQNDFPVKDQETDRFEATIWLGDRFHCSGCGAGVVVGFGKGRPASECSSLRRDEAMEFRAD